MTCVLKGLLDFSRSLGMVDRVTLRQQGLNSDQML